MSNRAILWRRIVKWTLAIYLVLPFFAGALGSANPHGPKIYPQAIHLPIFQVGHIIFQGKAASKYTQLYERPWFYGMKRRLQFKSAPPDWPEYDRRF
jgi:hypothetical protein